MFDYLTQQQLIQKVRAIDPVRYNKGRNYVNWAVSRLSPYITHGVITTPQAILGVLEQYGPEEAESLLKELLWKERFMNVHYRKWDAIFDNLEESKTKDFRRDILPWELQLARTWQNWLDLISKELTQTGYLHNHMRMWMASYLVHYQKLYWKKLADWTYYHFLDWELASNHLSRQWVASTFSSKPYIFNADNMNRYWPNHHPKQLHMDYPKLETMLFEWKTDMTWYTDSELPTIRLEKTSDYPEFDSNELKILTPRHLGHVTANCVVVLDMEFLKLHPWSKQRIEWVSGYVQFLGWKVIIWSYHDTITYYQGLWKILSLYETVNPVYRQVNKWYADIVPFEWVGPWWVWYVNRFFWYRKKTENILWALRRGIVKESENFEEDWSRKDID